MGNSSTKEQKLPANRLSRSADSRVTPSSTIASTSNSGSQPEQLSPNAQPLHNSQNARSSRSELSSLLGMGNAAERDGDGMEHRKETKQEREARRLKRERIAREKERERSMREENVDGGFLVTQGVYTGIEDFSKAIVRQLMIERRLAPFWRGLNDHSDSWTENQLVAAARGRPIPAPDEIPAEDQYEPAVSRDPQEVSSRNLNNLTVPISSRSQSYNSDSSSNLSPAHPTFVPQQTNLPVAASSSGSALFRGRAKTLASLTTSAKNTQTEMSPREMSLPKDPFVSGQPIEAYLYKDASECPICFLYYPPYLNKTRCCDQAICSECFVQIKRSDPHPPEHVDPSARPVASIESVELEETNEDDTLVSEPAACPFCVEPEFGVTYESPSFRRGLTYVNQATSSLANVSSAMSSSSSLASAVSGAAQLSPTAPTRRRTTSLSATAPAVITTDRIRPDWHQKLMGARAHAARRSAAATALHTAAYIMGNRNSDSDGRSFTGFGRRGILRRASGNDATTGPNPHLNMLALMSERYAAASSARADIGNVNEDGQGRSSSHRGASRRSRMEDLEDMMMMEAIRLSLASEEDRRKREEKEAKKEAKKKDKENKRAEKMARKVGISQTSANHSSAGFDNSTNESSPLRDEFPLVSGKGKGVQSTNVGQSSARSSDLDLSPSTAKSYPVAANPVDSAQVHLERARAQLQPNEGVASAMPYSSNPYRPSHLRTLSNASSSGSSIEGAGIGPLADDLHRSNSSFEVSPNASGVNILPRASAQDTLLSDTPPGGGAGLEPMFNFRSLAAMVGEDEKLSDVSSGEFMDIANDRSHQGHLRGESSNSVAPDVNLFNNATNTHPVLSTSVIDERPAIAEKGSHDYPPEVKITTPSRVNSGQGLSNQVNDMKTVEANFTSENAEAVSG